jgi:CheY-like chemotaxis protein
MNLFVNARDAMPDGGKISVSAENIAIDAAYVQMHINARVGAYVMVTVADSGIGMTHEVLDRIFDPFFTTKDTGTGLGLSTVLGIINSHGGFINVYSEVGRGSRFQVYLPAVVMPEPEPTILRPTSFDGRGRWILVVDDEEAVREITKNTLESYNYRVMLASDGVEAIALYTQHQDRLAAVLLDVMMPMLNTPATIRSLQQLHPQVVIVAMSGLAANREVVNGAGVSAFLTKPFTAEDLLQILEKTIGARERDIKE